MVLEFIPRRRPDLLLAHVVEDRSHATWKPVQQFDHVPEQVRAIAETQSLRLPRQTSHQGNAVLDRIFRIGAETRVIDLERLGLAGMKLEIAALIKTGMALDVAARLEGDPP